MDTRLNARSNTLYSENCEKSINSHRSSMSRKKDIKRSIKRISNFNRESLTNKCKGFNLPNSETVKD